MISIGKPEIGLKLCDHLGVSNIQEYIYADPENKCYSNLKLNSGWNTMIRPATVSLSLSNLSLFVQSQSCLNLCLTIINVTVQAFRFKERFSKKGSMKSLFEVLGKWSDAVYIPPKFEQSTNHGGTFLFRDNEVLFAHYDESPGTHYDPNEAVKMAIEAGN